MQNNSKIGDGTTVKTGDLVRTSQWPHQDIIWKVAGVLVGTPAMLAATDPNNPKNRCNLVANMCRQPNTDSREQMRQKALKMIKDGKQAAGLRLLRVLNNQ